jgi:GT2 family glycosyltransferase
VVDGSSDGTIEMLNAKYPEVHIVHGDGTWWYTRSMNEGFKLGESLRIDYFITLNDDCEIKENFIETLYKDYQKLPQNSIIGSFSFTVDRPHKVIFSGQKTGNVKLYKFRPYLKQFSIIDPEQIRGIQPTFTLPGRGIFVPHEILKRLNYFDETFPQYASDNDFCLRALKKNIAVYVSWNSHIFVHENETGSGIYYEKQSLKQFSASFFDNHSIASLKKDFILFYRHTNKLLFLFIFFVKFIRRWQHYINKKIQKIDT